MNIQNSVAFVTGGNRGLGLEFAKELLAQGASKVYIGVRNPELVRIPGLIPIKLDVTDPQSVLAAAAKASDTTILINNAGIAKTAESTLDSSIISDSRSIFETNYYGLISVSQAFAPVLEKNGGGAIMNILSIATWISGPLLAAYSASKSAAWSFTNAFRLEVKPKNIQVLSFHVGFMDTDMTKGLDAPKLSPKVAAQKGLEALREGKEEVLIDPLTVQVKASLSTETPAYLQMRE